VIRYGICLKKVDKRRHEQIRTTRRHDEDRIDCAGKGDNHLVSRRLYRYMESCDLIICDPKDRSWAIVTNGFLTLR
jgi:hypothetical protein